MAWFEVGQRHIRTKEFRDAYYRRQRVTLVRRRPACKPINVVANDQLTQSQWCVPPNACCRTGGGLRGNFLNELTAESVSLLYLGFRRSAEVRTTVLERAASLLAVDPTKNMQCPAWLVLTYANGVARKFGVLDPRDGP